MRRFAFITLALASALAALPARAGDRPLELLLVNMSPRGTHPDCMRNVQRVFRGRDADTNLHRLGSDRVRDLAGHGRDDRNFLLFERDELDAAVTALRTDIDAIALVDCRAEEGRVSMWISAANRGVARIELTNTVIDEARGEWIGRTIAMHAWIGFNP